MQNDQYLVVFKWGFGGAFGAAEFVLPVSEGA
jgi:hypothetical protein